MHQGTEEVSKVTFFLLFIYCRIYHEEEWYKTGKMNILSAVTSCLSSTAVLIFSVS